MQPIEDVIAGIERRLEHEYGQCRADCPLCAMVACESCEQIDLMALDSATPVHTYSIPCAAHALPDLM